MKNQSQKTRRKVLKIIGLGFAGLILLSMVVILILGSTPPSIPLTPSGVKQFQAVYIPMQDGTQIAVRISLPPDLGNDQRIPAVIETTRYLTDIKSTFLLNTALKLSGDTKMNLRVGHALMEAGYAYIRVDARGSGASFGRREMELSQEEIADMGEIIDWVVQQPWSNGKVGTYGISYSGNTAELAAALNHPNLKAVAPLYSDFDHLTGNLMPGGILNTFLTENWSAMVATMDANAEEGLFHGGIAPVDEDEDEMLLTDALAERDNIDIAERLHTVTYFDDLLTPDYTAHSIAPLYYKESIQQSGLPFYVRVGWLDAGTVDGAISRYLTFSNPQQLWIGPWNHSGTRFYDPFLKNQTTETPMIIQQ
jgi:putative CocE/NonD family hydrolase